MSIEGLIGSALVALVLLMAVLWPFVIQPRRSVSDEALTHQRERALTYYERVLNNIRDLDEDHATGKIDTETYTVERENWAQRGAQLLKLLDELDHDHAIAPQAADEAEIDAAIEASIDAAMQHALQERTTATTRG